MKLSQLAFALLLAVGACGGKSHPTAATPEAPAAKKTPLYDRLGQRPAIEAVVDKFLGHIVADERINKFFAGLTPDDVARVRLHLVEQVCNATGGPCEYTGKDMVTTHTGMNLTHDHFVAIVEDLVAAMNDLSVPKPEQDELLGILGPLESQIVGK